MDEIDVEAKEEVGAAKCGQEGESGSVSKGMCHFEFHCCREYRKHPQNWLFA